MAIGWPSNPLDRPAPGSGGQASLLRRYGIGVLLGLAAVLLRAALNPWLGPAMPALTVFGAVAIATLYVGVGPAVLVAAIGYGAALYFLWGAGMDARRATIGLTGLLPYGLSTALIIAVCARLTSALREAKQATQALRDNETRFRLALEGLPIIVGVIDRDLRYTWIYNPRAQLSPDQILGRRDDEFMPDADVTELIAAKREIIDTGRPVRREIRVRQGAEERCFEFTGEPLHDESGAVVGATTASIDITERKRAEQALRAADRRKDEFLATLAHELRNPLAPIRTAAHVLRSPALAEPQREQAREMIDRQVRTMTRLIDELLDVSRLEFGRIVLRREPLRVADVIRDAVETSDPAIAAGRHRLRIAPCGDDPWVSGDATRLSQVLVNLLTNAARYTPPGGEIDVSTQVEGGQVAIRVRDNGIGIPAPLQSGLFEMFGQVHGPAAGAGGGLGIGLALARKLVELHGGTIAAHSEGEGRGTELVVRLPTCAAPSAAVSATGTDARSASSRRN